MAKMTKVFLLRHGETNYNVEKRFLGMLDISLNERGRRQADYIRKYLIGKKIDVVYTSPLIRAEETARIALKRREVSIITEECFREICCGDWEGLTGSEVLKKWPNELNKWKKTPQEVRIPKGEEFAQVSDRMFYAFKRLISLNEGKTILIFSHMIGIQLLLMRLNQIDICDFWNVKQVDNASVSYVNIRKGDIKVQAWADTSHLPENECNKHVEIAGFDK